MRSLSLVLCFALMPMAALADMHVLIVEGLGGDPVYTEQFNEEQQALHKASESLTSSNSIVTLSGEAATKERITGELKALAKSLKADDRLVVYLVGHGSYDGYEYKFNIPGPDITATELGKLLDALPAKNQLIVATGSASGALADALKKDSRVVITATRSGSERNVTHFGIDFAEALRNASTDTDKNGRITAQEAFDAASRGVKDYFEKAKRLASEHPRLEGDLAARFTVAQLGSSGTAAPASSANPQLAALQTQRDKLNGQIEELRLRKDSMDEAEYSKELEKLVLELADVEDKLESQGGSGAGRER